MFKRHSKPELEIYEFVKSKFPDAINGKSGLLHNKRFELDIYVPSLNKAIEYNGPTHDPDHNLYKGSQDRDYRKELDCKETGGIELLKIDYKEFELKNVNKQLAFDKISEFLNE